MLMLPLFTFIVNAQEAAVELDAADVDCRKCHDDPHKIHSTKNLQCKDCHGEASQVKIPQCINCHKGPIHEVHRRKVETETCAHCHINIQGKHDSLLGDSICEHCHKDLISIHGGEVAACSKCHGSPGKITKPARTTTMTVVCENCHQADSIATIHGSKDDAQTCYRCHREGVGETETVKIPHIIHVPKIDCMTCHWSLKDDNIIVPKCSKCHTVDKIHSFASIGKGMKGTVECAICHPNLSIQRSMGELTEIPGRVNPGEVEATSPVSTPPIPGFGWLLSALALIILYKLKNRD